MAFNFGDKLINEGGGTLIVDSLNLAFRWKHRKETDFRYKYQQTVQSLARSYDCSEVIITADWGSSTFRKGIDEEYKQNRKDKIAEQSEQDRMEFEEFISEYEETLELLSEDYPILRFRGVEADDIAAHLVKNRKRYGMDFVWLISSDRDWDLLIQENVGRFSYVTRKETTLDNWESHYDVLPEEYISYKCLTGDSGDNVAGIPGVGPKRAISLINEYGSALDIYDAVPINSKYKYIQNLNEHAERILVNYQLMDLITYCDDAIGADNVSAIEEKLSAA
jgi:DNA polymerase-1